MKLTDPQELQNYFHAHGFKPKDYMGQNFLIDEDVLDQIVAAADLKPSDTVLEVGPGLGVLTEQLLTRAGKVVAVEKDQRLFEILRQTFNGSAASIGERLTSSVRKPHNAAVQTIRAALTNNVQLINQDILRFHLDQHIIGPYKVVANIPYYLTSKLFQFFLEQKNQPELLVLMVQKEVGERVVAKPGELSLLGISVQIYSDPEIVTSVSKNSFWPVPQVDSVILKIIPKNKYPEITDKKLFFGIIKKAFAGKRKQLHNTLGKELLVKAGINLKARPQELSIENWIKIYKASSSKDTD